MAAGLPARRDPCGDYLRQATLVDFRGSILSDAGSIPAISTQTYGHQAVRFVIIQHYMNHTLSALFLLAALSAACQSTATGSLPTATQSARPLPSPSAIPKSTASPIPPTETLAPAARSFTEGFDGNLPYWSFIQVDNGQPASQPAIQGGFLVFDLSSPNQWVYAVYDGPDYADVRIDAQVEDRSGANGNYGVVCRYTEKDGWYEFNVFADQTYELLFGQWLAPGVARFTPLLRTKSEKIRPDANEVGLLCQDNTLTPFINGVQMRKWDVTRFALPKGKVGISTSSFETVPTTMAFDWVKVSEP